MPIPDYQTVMLPVLKTVADGESHLLRDISKAISDQFELTDEERGKRLPSGQQTIIANRIGWATTYLKKAGLLEYPARGKRRLTEEGKKLLKENPPSINAAYLKRYPSFVEFTTPTDSDDSPGPSTSEPGVKTPEETLDESYGALRNELASELIDMVKSCSPQFFEQLVVDLLVAMGYGGSLADAGQTVGKSGDGGIDGIIKEDKLGLDAIYIQAKRWENTVGRPVVQAFAGSMEGFRARKGVVITTSTFSKDAQEYVTQIERKIVLIDGKRLARLMIDHDIGVTTARSYLIKRADTDYFTEEEA